MPVDPNGRRVPAQTSGESSIDQRATVHPVTINEDATPSNRFITSEAMDEAIANYRGGRELARASTSAVQTGITAIVDITGLTIEFDVTDRPVDVVLWLPWLIAVTNPASATAHIADDANVSKAWGPTISAAAGTNMPGLKVEERIIVPGHYIRKGRIQRGSGTGTVSVGDTIAGVGVHFISAIER